jgi:glycine dehydrogenase subunit 1
MRYLPLTQADRTAMLATIGAASIEDLFRDVPAEARVEALFDLPLAQGELQVERAIGALAARNVPAGSVPSFLGAGVYRHHVPAAVDHLIQRGEFLTAYTPYQPEVAQGTLQSLFEFQTQVALITDMEVANASLYDGSTACAEAIQMANRVTRRGKAILSGGLHPHYRDVARTHARFGDFRIEAAPPDAEGTEDLEGQIDRATSCVVVQNPDVFGRVRDYSALAEACHAQGALLVVVITEILSLGAVMAPGTMGADIVAAEGQSLGNPMSFGGPHVGLFATRERYLRQMPGRICGQTVDRDGKRGWVLTLSTREQHIRREKATSNVCTNAGLCALAFTIHLALLGETGFTDLAKLNHALAVTASDRLARIPGVTLLNESFFNEFTLRLGTPAGPVVDRLAARGILAGVPVSRLLPEEPDLADLLLVAVTETTIEADLEAFATALEEILS